MAGGEGSGEYIRTEVIRAGDQAKGREREKEKVLIERVMFTKRSFAP